MVLLVRLKSVTVVCRSQSSPAGNGAKGCMTAGHLIHNPHSIVLPATETFVVITASGTLSASIMRSNFSPGAS